MLALEKHLIVCNGRWLVVQLRQHCITSFTRNWTEYQSGFGSLQTDLWLGLEALHQITHDKPHQARILMIADNGTVYMAEYSRIIVDHEVFDYRLRVFGHSGNASDDISTTNDDRITNGRPFSTRDRDNDASPGNCAEKRYSPWWHNKCSAVDLNTPCKNQDGYQCPHRCLMWYSITTPNGPPLNYTRIEIMPISS